MHELIAAKDASVRTLVVRGDAYEQRGADEPEEGEEAVKGRLGAERILAIKGRELARKDEIAEATLALSLTSVLVQAECGFFGFALDAGPEDVADLGIVGFENVLATAAGLLECDLDTFPSALKAVNITRPDALLAWFVLRYVPFQLPIGSNVYHAPTDSVADQSLLFNTSTFTPSDQC